MNEYHNRPDGEYFTDAPDRTVPPKSKWAEMTMPELLDAKTKLLNNAEAFRRSPQILHSLNQGIAAIDRVIAERLKSQ